MLINDANFKMIIDLVYTKEYEKTALNLSEKKHYLRVQKSLTIHTGSL